MRHASYDPRTDTRRGTARPLPGADDRRHALRPGVSHEGVHGGRRRAADRTGHARHRRQGRGVPAGLPGRCRANGVTVRQLLTHTSGLRPELPLYDCADDEERLRRLRAEPPVGVPGTYCYSDLNMLLLQQVLERITGRGLDVLVHDGITRPLGMTATHFGRCPGAAATEDQRRPWARRTGGMLRGVVHDENAWALGGVAGHAGLFSTGRDLAVFCRALLAGGSYGPARILGPRFRGTAPDRAGARVRPGPAVVHGRAGGARGGRAHRVHGHDAGPRPEYGHVRGPPRQHGPSTPPRPGQRAPGGAGGRGWRGRCGRSERGAECLRRPVRVRWGCG